MAANTTHKFPSDRDLLDTSIRPTKRRKRTMRWLVATAGIGIIASVAVLTSLAKPTEATTTDPVDTALEILPDEVFAVAPTDLTQIIKVVGSLSPARRVDLSARVSGIVQAVSTMTGEAIKAGAELISIDVEDLGLQASFR